MSRIPRLTSEQRADLVAYLDGELGDEESRSIEQALAASDVARHEIEMLSRTWELLDTLPRENASADFAAKTIASIKVEAAPTAVRWEPLVNRILITIGWVSVLAASLVLGYSVGSRWIPREDDEYVRDLPILERLDSYRDIGSVEFLERLTERRLPLQPETVSR